MSEFEPGLSSAEAARFLGVSRITMGVWRARGTGPPHTYSGEKPIYRMSELKSWQEACAAKMHAQRAAGAAAVAESGAVRRRGRPKRMASA